MLAPAAGRVPGANFVPLYTTLYGWAIVPFRHLLSVNGLANMATIILSCLSVLALVLAVVLARRTLPARSLWLAVGLTVPLATVTVLHGNIYSSIASVLQELPIRIFPAMLYSVIAVDSLVALLQHSVRKVSLISLGLFAGLMAWNSQDFGLAVAVAYGIVLQIATRGDVRKRARILWLSGLVPGVLLYPLWTLAIGHPIQLKYLNLISPRVTTGWRRGAPGGLASQPDSAADATGRVSQARWSPMAGLNFTPRLPRGGSNDPSDLRPGNKPSCAKHPAGAMRELPA